MSKLKYVSRWIFFFPAATMAAFLVWYAAKFLANYYLAGMATNYLFWMLNPRSILGILLQFSISGVAMGVTFVRVGVAVSPSHHRKVSFVLCFFVLLLVSCGIVFDPPRGDNSTLIIVGLIFTAIGSIVAVEPLWYKLNSPRNKLALKNIDHAIVPVLKQPDYENKR
jgi:hypothetical protein